MYDINNYSDVTRTWTDKIVGEEKFTELIGCGDIKKYKDEMVLSILSALHSQGISNILFTYAPEDEAAAEKYIESIMNISNKLYYKLHIFQRKQIETICNLNKELNNGHV